METPFAIIASVLGATILTHVLGTWWAWRKQIDEEMEEDDCEFDYCRTAFLTKEGDIVYAYDQDDNFLGQGKTIKELVDHMTALNPGAFIRTTRKELQKVGFDVK